MQKNIYHLDFFVFWVYIFEGKIYIYIKQML